MQEIPDAAGARGFFWTHAILLAALLLGIVLRGFHLHSHELQYDEAATGYFASLPWADLWGAPALLEPNPPLFYSLAWLVTRAGGSVEQIRGIPLIAGVLCIPLAWAIARRIAGDFAGGAAALLIAVSPQHAAISQYARAYALLILCLMLAFFCLLKASQKLWAWAGYVIAAAAALYTHHTAIIVLFALNLALALTLRRPACWPFLRQLLAANLLIAALYAPWLPVLAAQALPSGVSFSAKAVSSNLALPRRLWNAIRSPFPFNGLPWIDVRFLPFILFGAWRWRRSRDMVFLAAFLFCGMTGMVLASQLHPLLDGKTLAWAAAFAMTAAAIGCNAAGRFRLPVLALMLLLQLRAIPAILDPTPEGWREMAAILRQSARPGDTVYINYAGAVLPLRHYGWPEEGLTIRVFADRDAEPWFRGRDWPIVPPREAGGDAREAKRVWLLIYGETPEAGRIAKEIEAASIRTLHRRTPKLDLSLFEPASP